MGLPPICQPPEENCYDYFYASKAAVRVRARVSFRVPVRFRLRLVSGLYNLLFYFALQL